MKKSDIGGLIEAKRDFFIAVDRKIWEYAETAFVEYRSADLPDDPSLLDAAKEDLRKRLDGHLYRCAIPENVTPRPMKAKE